MVVIQRSPGEAIRIGPYTLRVLSVHGDEVVVAVIDADRDCSVCGERPAEPRRCPVCATETLLCSVCAPDGHCPECAPVG
jgi:hypothetical protein